MSSGQIRKNKIYFTVDLSKFLDFVLSTKFLQSFTPKKIFEGERGYIFTYKHLRVYTVTL
jgi:hypothetical protein